MQISTKCGLNRTMQHGSRFNIQLHVDHSFLAYKNQDMCEPNFEYTHTHTHHFLSEDIKHSQKKKNKDTNKQTKPKKHMPVFSCPQMLSKFNSSNHKTIHLHPY